MKKWEFSIRTDLAVEAREVAGGQTQEELAGVSVETTEHKSYTITHVTIHSQEGSEAMGKPQGNYITIESERLKDNDADFQEEMMKTAAQYLVKLAKLQRDSVILVVGLGNWNITPDALGPKVVSKVLVTRHIQEGLPKEVEGTVRSVAAISPGVMGITGIETGEIIKGVVERVKPDIVIAIDALAARKSNRINATIQISDTGISPGAGVGNQRQLLDEETLGVPVIALGVPTVVDAATLVNDTLDTLLDSMRAQSEKGSAFYDMLCSMDGEDKYRLILDILDPYQGNLFVTPKEVDAVIDRLANVLANAINIAVHPGVTIDDINRYTF